MARPVSLAQMVLRVRQRADIENKNQRFSPNEIQDALVEGIAETYEKLLLARGHGYYEKDVALSTVAGQSLYPLEATFMSLKNVSMVYNGETVTFTPFDLQEAAQLRSPGAGGVPCRYRVRASNIELLPVPSGVYTVTLTIVPAPPTLVDDNFDDFDGICGWEELAICSAARKAAIKNGYWQLVGVLEKDIESVKERIAALAPKRNEGPPNKILDVRSIERQNRRYRFR